MSIKVIIGPMFSGKTTELVRLIDRQRISGKRCLIIKNSNDTRYDQSNSNIIRTHAETGYHKCDILHTNDLDNTFFNNIKKKYDAIGIDEGFMFKNIASFSNKLANAGIDVIVSSIDSSYQQKLFPNIGELLSISEQIIKLSGICMKCRKSDAYFTIRTIESEEEILVGGSEMYQCVCRTCLVSHTLSS